MFLPNGKNMALIICEKHGRQACVFASPHFVKTIGDGNKISKNIIVLELNLMEGQGFHWVDESFLKENNIQSEICNLRITIGDQDKAFDIFCNLSPVCIKCYEEYLQQHELQRPHLA